MTEQPPNQSFVERGKALFQKGMRNHVVAQKDGRKVVDLPVNLVALGAVLAVWLVAIMWVVGLLYGYEIRIIDSELEVPEQPSLPEPGAMTAESDPAPDDTSV